jgi:hypothetical protein
MLSSRQLAKFDNAVVDGAVDGVGAAVAGLGRRLRLIQRGQIQESLTLALGIAAVVILFLILMFQ